MPYGYRYLRSLLASFGQIFFQQSALCGAFIIVGIAVSSPMMLAGGLLGASIALWVAGFLEVESQQLCQGFYGFNGALIGLAGCYFFQADAISFALISCASGLATLMQRVWLKRLQLRAARSSTGELRRIQFEPYTAPYILVFWLLMALYEPVAIPMTENSSSLCSALLNSIAQVCFQQSPLSGLLFVIGIAISSIRAAVWMLLAVVISLVCSLVIQLDPVVISSGAYGYNAALIALGCAGRARLRQLRVLLAVVPVTLLLTLLFEWLGVMPLTAPLVLLLWLVSWMPERLFIQKEFKQRALSKESSSEEY
ncbi:MAG: urea transporter [Halopseudomonas sp.]